MRRFARHWPWLLAVLVGVGAVLFLRKSESDRIREDLESVAGALRFDGRFPRPTWVARLRSSLAEHVANPVTISVAPMAESSYSVEPLLDHILQQASNLDALGITISNIGVSIDESGRRATAKGEVHLDILEPSTERRSEPRKFAATLERNADGWVVVHAQFGEARIDQPEARP